MNVIASRVITIERLARGKQRSATSAMKMKFPPENAAMPNARTTGSGMGIVTTPGHDSHIPPKTITPDHTVAVTTSKAKLTFRGSVSTSAV